MSDNYISVSAPYRFVPLAPFVVVPEWGLLVSHDHPFEDGVSGELRINMINKSPICVGGEQIPATEKTPGKVSFSRNFEGILAIPGSSIKGMLRSVLEIATFSRFNQVEDQKMGIRDLQNTTYKNQMTKTPSKSGWLNFQNGKWTITPCNFVRIHQEEIINYFGIKTEEWVLDSLKTAPARYKRFNGCAPKVKFNYMPGNKHITHLAKLMPLHAKADAEGYLVVTGQPGASFKTPKGKKYEFIFHTTQPQTSAIPISAEVKAGFDQIYQESTDWFYLKKLMNTPNLNSPGVPVFYHENNGQIASFGLSLMYRLPFKNSLHQVIANSSAEHISREFPDFSDLIFGFLNDENSNSSGLRGRVSFTDAMTKMHLMPTINKETILNSPKPSFYPAYISQDKTDYVSLLNDRAKLTGWKRYPIKSVEIPKLNDKSLANKKVQVQLESLPENSQFEHIIRFHNLRRVELGALLWAIDFGSDKECYHGLGTGKSLGFGAVQLSIDAAYLQINNIEHNNINNLDYLSVCRKEFIDYMQNVVAKLSPDTDWLTSPPIKNLKLYAQFEASKSDGIDPNSLHYLDGPKKFVELKKEAYLNDVKDIFHKFEKISTTAPIVQSDSYPQFNHLGVFNAYFDIVASENAAQEEKKLMIARKEAMQEQISQASAEEALLLKLELVFSEWKDMSTKTKAKNLEDQLRIVESSLDKFQANDLDKLKGIVAKCAEINKPISKIVKKIKEFF